MLVLVNFWVLKCCVVLQGCLAWMGFDLAKTLSFVVLLIEHVVGLLAVYWMSWLRHDEKVLHL
jgi:hypothetical protein